MFCSTVISTIGRPELSRAVCSVLDQDFKRDDFEVIVVNDSGQPLPEAVWQKSERVQVINTFRRERCVARNVGAAIAKGKFLHFLDDDDWLLPNALESFWLLAREGNTAAWIYGRSQLADRQGQKLIQLDHGMKGNCFIQVMAGEWIPLQASLVNAKTFFAIGGFNPLIPGIEDIDLARRIALHAEMKNIPATVACIGIGEESSATDYNRAARYSRWAREKILNEPGTFTRMRKSANSSYWYGRIVRAYLTSVVWNLKRKNPFIAASRTMFGLLGFVLAGYYIFSNDFWQAISKAYESQTFLRGFQEAELPVERRNIASFT